MQTKVEDIKTELKNELKDEMKELKQSISELTNYIKNEKKWSMSVIETPQRREQYNIIIIDEWLFDKYGIDARQITNSEYKKEKIMDDFLWWVVASQKHDFSDT